MADVTERDLQRAEMRQTRIAAGAEAERIMQHPLVVAALDGMERSLLDSLRKTALHDVQAMTAATAGLQACHIFRETFAGAIRAAAYAKAEEGQGA